MFATRCLCSAGTIAACWQIGQARYSCELYEPSGTKYRLNCCVERTSCMYTSLWQFGQVAGATGPRLLDLLSPQPTIRTMTSASAADDPARIAHIGRAAPHDRVGVVTW